MDIHEKLKLIFRSHGKTQDNIAKVCGVSRISVNRFLKGHTDLRSKDFVAVLREAGIDLESMVDAKLNAIITASTILPDGSR